MGPRIREDKKWVPAYARTRKGEVMTAMRMSPMPEPPLELAPWKSPSWRDSRSGLGYDGRKLGRTP